MRASSTPSSLRAFRAEAEILATLVRLFARFASEREPRERFGDFVVRAGILRRV
jgi:sulfite reductase (NADPH) hemoprotein beta-component